MPLSTRNPDAASRPVGDRCISWQIVGPRLISVRDGMCTQVFMTGQPGAPPVSESDQLSRQNRSVDRSADRSVATLNSIPGCPCGSSSRAPVGPRQLRLAPAMRAGMLAAADDAPMAGVLQALVKVNESGSAFATCIIIVLPDSVTVNGDM